MLTVGIPSEIKPLEKRVGLVPSAVSALTRLGISVAVQKGAGLGSGFSDEDYVKARARILEDAQSIYQTAGLIQKVKEPLPAEFPLLRSGQILFCFLHLASPENSELVKALVTSGVTAIGYETLEVKGRLPLLMPMSEIAGALSSAYAAYFHSLDLISKGIKALPQDFLSQLEKIAASYPNLVSSAKIGNVVIFGGGIAGEKAMEVALKLKASVTVIEKSLTRREEIKEKIKRGLAPCLSGRQAELQGAWPHQVLAPDELTETILVDADILIGCVHSKGARAIQVLTPELLKKISAKKKKIIMDVSIDQGGNFPEAHATTYQNPIYQDSFGNIRFAVANIPSLCGRYASEALSEKSYHYTLALADDAEEAFRDLPELAQAVNVHNREIILQTVR